MRCTRAPWLHVCVTANPPRAKLCKLPPPDICHEVQVWWTMWQSLCFGCYFICGCGWQTGAPLGSGTPTRDVWSQVGQILSNPIQKKFSKRPEFGPVTQWKMRCTRAPWLHVCATANPPRANLCKLHHPDICHEVQVWWTMWWSLCFGCYFICGCGWQTGAP